MESPSSAPTEQPSKEYVHSASLLRPSAIKLNWPEIGWALLTFLLLCSIVALGIWEAKRS